MGSKSVWDKWLKRSPREWFQVIFILYVLFLSFLLLIHNPFAYVPVDEEMVEKGFGLNLSPHVLAFVFLAILGLSARFRHSGWLYLGMFAYAGGTELLQGWLHPWFGRYCDWIDFWDNVQGLIYGGLGWWLPTVCFRKVRKSSPEMSGESVFEAECFSEENLTPEEHS